MILSTHLHSYLAVHYPDIADEATERLSSVKCNPKLVRAVSSLAANHSSETWEFQITTIASVLVLCSPETIHAKSKVRNGIAVALSKVLGISRQAVCQKVDRSRHYYLRVGWCREAVNKIVKEVRGNG